MNNKKLLATAVLLLDETGLLKKTSKVWGRKLALKSNDYSYLNVLLQ